MCNSRYTYSQNGSKTFVCEGVQFYQTERNSLLKLKKDLIIPNKNIVSFRSGISDLEAIPIKKWAQIYQKIALDIEPSQMDYQSPFGDYELRTQLALYLQSKSSTRPLSVQTSGSW